MTHPLENYGVKLSDIFGFNRYGAVAEGFAGAGGYSGGFAGITHQDENKTGGGGGSFIHPDFAVHGSQLCRMNGTTSDPSVGHILYRFSANAPATLAKGHEYSSGATTLLRNGDFRLEWQNDSNLVLYYSGTARWATGTSRRGAILSFQGDGNLVIYGNDGFVWASSTANSQPGGKGGNRLVLDFTGTLFITNADGRIIWSVN